ncbi:MAG: hypothetical protein ACMXYA_03260 [Candidatus Woesearchaeota archaeon]
MTGSLDKTVPFLEDILASNNSVFNQKAVPLFSHVRRIRQDEYDSLSSIELLKLYDVLDRYKHDLPCSIFAKNAATHLQELSQNTSRYQETPIWSDFLSYAHTCCGSCKKH